MSPQQPNAKLDAHSEVGPRLRAARLKEGLSLRELARRVDISASALSQVERGQSRPSVQTLYALVTELGLSLDTLFEQDDEIDSGGDRPSRRSAPSSEGSPGAVVVDRAVGERAAQPHHGPVQGAGDRASLKLDSGVTWERLTASHDAEVDFLFVTYDVGGASSAGDELIRHSGREYGVVLKGELEVTVGFETYWLGPGDSISFDSNEPHRLRNSGEVPTEAIWFVIGRRQTDPRSSTMQPAAEK